MKKLLFALVTLLLMAWISLLMATLAIPASPTFSGDVETDFTGPGILTIPDPFWGVDLQGSPGGAPPGTISSWDLKEPRWNYNSESASAVIVADAAPALCPTTLSVTITSHPYLLVDANKPGEEGPLVTTVYASVKNEGATVAENVYVHIGNGTAPGSFPAGSDGDRLGILGPTSDATRFLVNLEPGESKTVFWMLTYPATELQTYPLTVWADSEAGCFAQDSHTFTTRHANTAAANKLLGTLSVNPPSCIVNPGQIVTATLTAFDFGQVGSGPNNEEDIWMQPLGNIDFDPTCLRLIRTEVYIHSIANVPPYGGMPYVNLLYFSGIKNQDPPPNYSGDTADYVKYYFIALKPCSTTIMPYQEAASGNVEKYSDDYGGPEATIVVTTEPGGISISKSVEPETANPDDTLTWTITYSNNSDFPIGDPDTGNGLAVIDQGIPEYTTYVPGSAEGSGNCIVYYSTDNGATWTTVEPAPEQLTKIKWYINEVIPANTYPAGTVWFQTMVDEDIPEGQALSNSVSINIGDGETLQCVLIAQATNSGPVYDGEDVHLFGAPNGMTSYYWTGPNSFSSMLQNPVVSPAIPGTYTLTVTNNEGCSGNDTTTVEVYDLLPDISVTKTANPTSVPEPGGNVEFTIEVSNNSAEGGNLTSLTDSAFGNLNGQGNCSLPQTIPGGGSYTCSVTKFISGDHSGPAHSNTVTATLSDDDGNSDTDTDDETVTFTSANPPSQPSDGSPNNGQCVGQPVELESSPFSDPDPGDTHLASQWQIRTSTGSYSSPAYDSGRDTSNLTSITIPPGVLAPSTAYCWHVRYQDDSQDLLWSIYSDEECFTTGNTIPGDGISVNLNGVTVTYSHVSGGCTSITRLNQNPPGTVPPLMCAMLPYLEITTTAIYSGPVTVTVYYNESAVPDENTIRLLHWNSTSERWDDVTTFLNTDQNFVQGTVDTLSPFCIGYACEGGVSAEYRGIVGWAPYMLSLANEITSYLFDLSSGGLTWSRSAGGQFVVNGNPPNLTQKSSDIIGAVMTIAHNGFVFLAQLSTLLPARE